MQTIPTPLQIAEGYAEAVVKAHASQGYVALHWDGQNVSSSEMEDGMTPEDVPVFVGQPIVVSYPWCPEGLRCIDWSDNATRSDIVKCLLESGYADRFAATIILEP